MLAIQASLVGFHITPDKIGRTEGLQPSVNA